MRSADFTRTAATLPALYHEDPVSYEQVDGYLGLADTLHEAMLELIEDLEFGVGPDAALRWPTDVPLHAGADTLLAELNARYDALAQWFAYETPGSWGGGEQGLAARRQFLAKAAKAVAPSRDALGIHRLVLRVLRDHRTRASALPA